MAYTKPTITGYNTSPPSDDGSATEANKVKWSTIKGKITDPVKVYSDAINDASETAWNDLASITTDDGTKGFHLVSYPPLPGETGVVNYEYHYFDIKRFGTNTTPGTTDMTAAINNGITSINATGGGALFFDGEDYLTDGVAPKAKVVLVGKGRFSTFFVASSSCNDVVNIADSVTTPTMQGFGMRDIGINGLNQNDGYCGISITAQSLLGEFNRLYIVNTKQDGFYYDGQRFAASLAYNQFPKTAISGGKWSWMDDILVYNCGLAASGNRNGFHFKDCSGPRIGRIIVGNCQNGAAVKMDGAAECITESLECWETVNAVHCTVSTAGKESGLNYFGDIKADYISEHGIHLEAGSGQIKKFTVGQFRAGSIGDGTDNTYSVVRLTGAAATYYIEECKIKGIQAYTNVTTTNRPKHIIEPTDLTRNNLFVIEQTGPEQTSVVSSLNGDGGFSTRNEVIINNDIVSKGPRSFVRQVTITSGTSTTGNHPLEVTPDYAIITPANAAAAATDAYMSSLTSTQFTLTSVAGVTNATWNVLFIVGDDSTAASSYGDGLMM